MKPQPLLKETILKKIKQNGGWVNCHAHFDRAYTVTPPILNQAHARLTNKWTLVDDMKKQSSEEDYYARIEQAVQAMIYQGVTACATFIDVDVLTELRAMKAAQAVKKKYTDKISLKLINQVIKGVIEPTVKQWAEKALEYADIIGGLPGVDRPNEGKHIDTLLSWAKETGKMVHVHVDQGNDPNEHETELLAEKTMEHGLEGKVVAVHAVSVAAHPKNERKELYKKMKASGLMVVCCPSAAISMKQIPFITETHNSIVPVVELLEEGILVGLGVDNISDIYMPFMDGDMYTEFRMMAEACRFYDIDKLVDISSTNGKNILAS